MADTKPVLAQAQNQGTLRHVDGLRACAILPVLLYHFFPYKAPGGFVGVDVFFVISGFLITQKMILNLKNDTFSFSTFYMRRIKRIIPVYGLTLLVILGAIPFFYTIAEAANILAAAKFSIAFAGNSYFSSSVDYFGVGATNNPLLHFWSLGVEEQFYFVVPFVLLVIIRFDRTHLLRYLVAVTLLSFTLSVILLLAGNTNFAFYQLPTRAWELLAGCILGQLPRPKLSGRFHNLLVALGLSLIFLSILLLDSHSIFPGPLAIPTVLGAMLIIRYSGAGRVGTALATPPLVFLGKISYSLYIFHWPIAVLTHDQPVTFRLLGLAACLLLSILSWKYIEQPARNSPFFTKKRTYLAFAAVCLGLLAIATCLELVPSKNGKFPTSWRGTDLWPVLEAKRDPARSTATSTDFSTEKPSLLVRVGDATAKPTFVVWGDSTALASLSGIDFLSASAHRSGLYINLKHGLTSQSEIGGYPFRPREDREPVLLWLESRTDIKQVLLFNSWILGKILNEEDVNEIVSLCKRLKRAGKLTYFFASNPVPNREAIRLSDWGFEFPEPLNFVSTEPYLRMSKWQSLAIEKLEAENLAKVIDGSKAFLEGDQFRMAENGKSYFLDYGHVTKLGAFRLMSFASPVLWPNTTTPSVIDRSAWTSSDSKPSPASSQRETEQP